MFTHMKSSAKRSFNREIMIYFLQEKGAKMQEIMQKIYNWKNSLFSLIFVSERNTIFLRVTIIFREHAFLFGSLHPF